MSLSILKVALWTNFDIYFSYFSIIFIRITAVAMKLKKLKKFILKLIHYFK